jgi:hypothetical protein
MASKESGLSFILDILSWAVLLAIAYYAQEPLESLLSNIPYGVYFGCMLMTVLVGGGQFVRIALLECPASREGWRAVRIAAGLFAARSIVLGILFAGVISAIAGSFEEGGRYYVYAMIAVLGYIGKETITMFSS